MAENPNQNELDFAKAFDELAALGDKPTPADFGAPAAAATTEAPAAPAAEAPVVEAPAVTAEEGIVATPGATEKVAEAPAAPVAEAPAPRQSDDDIIQRFAKAVKEQVAQPEPQARQPEPEPELYSPEEKQLLDTYAKDWPDVAKAEALVRRAEYRQFAQYMFSEVAKHLQPIAQVVQTISERTQLSDLRQEVSDYDDIRDKVVEWVGKQPAYLQPAYVQVVQRGTPDEVVDLINRFKQDTGYVAPSAAAPGAAPAAPAQRAQDPALKQAAAALAPVRSQRTAPPQAEPTTFEDAFKAFAAKV